MQLTLGIRGSVKLNPVILANESLNFMFSASVMNHIATFAFRTIMRTANLASIHPK